MNDRFINVGEYNSDYQFDITGVSYIGNPKPNKVMYVSKKISHMLNNLKDVRDCLVFAESGSDIPAGIEENNCIILCDNPQLEYVKLVRQIDDLRQLEERSVEYNFVNGSYIASTVKLGGNVYIEPGCRIGHNVVIGNNAILHTGTVISNVTVGDNFISNECAVIGANGFTMAEDTDGNKIRIPSLGQVSIGDNVEIGAHNNISRGSARDTVLHDNVKLDAFVHVGHDVILYSNVEATAGVVVGGFAEIGANTFIGINSSIRNRVTIGEGVTIGMGAVVTKSIDKGVTVVGNPAKNIVEKWGVSAKT